MKTALCLVVVLGIRLAFGADNSPTPPTGPSPAKVEAVNGRPDAKATEGGNAKVTPAAGESARSSLSNLGLRIRDFFGGAAGAANPKSRIEGTVVDSEGKAAPNVTVSLFPYSQGEPRTDAKGHFTLTLATNPDQFWRDARGSAAIIARDFDRNLATTVDVDENSTHVSLKLELGLTLAGRVTDPKGNGIPQADIQVLFMSEGMGCLLGQPNRADPEGRFEVKALPSGRRYSVNVTAKGYGSDNRLVETPDAATQQVDLGPLQLAVADQRIAGVVVDEADKPVKGVMIFTFGTGQASVNGQTDAQGRFAFDQVCAGPIHVSAHKPVRPTLRDRHRRRRRHQHHRQAWSDATPGRRRESDLQNNRHGPEPRWRARSQGPRGPLPLRARRETDRQRGPLHADLGPQSVWGRADQPTRGDRP